jgi:hypothetical protein
MCILSSLLHGKAGKWLTDIQPNQGLATSGSNPVAFLVMGLK